MAVEFGVLGSVEVRIDGVPVPVGPAREQCVLAVLLADAGKVVGVDQLVERVWGPCPVPADARNPLRTYLSRLRRIAGVRIEHHSRGYVLLVPPSSVDVHRFRALVAQARAAPDEDHALALLDQALGTWRGEPWRAWSRRGRTACAKCWNPSATRRNWTGRTCGCAAATTTLCSPRWPSAPPSARSTSGWPASSCSPSTGAAVRRRRWRTTTGCAGAWPASSASTPYRHCANCTSASCGRASTPSRRSRPGRTPGCPPRGRLPAAVPHFTGRAGALAELDESLAAEPAVAVAAISGTAGVGKTALAVHWAHRSQAVP